MSSLVAPLARSYGCPRVLAIGVLDHGGSDQLASAGEVSVMGDDRWTGDLLERMRRAGDPLADSTVRAVFDKGEVAAVNELLTRLVRNDDIPPGPWPPLVAEYLRLSEQ